MMDDRRRTPTKDVTDVDHDDSHDDDDVDDEATVPGTIKRHVQRHESAADVMIGNIRPLCTALATADHDDSHDDDDDEVVVPSTIKRHVRHHENAADAMIGSIRPLLLTPPPPSAVQTQRAATDQSSSSSQKDFHDDDGELHDEIRRLPSIVHGIRQDLDSQHLESIGFYKKKKAIKESVVDYVGPDDRQRLVLFVMLACWTVIFVKEWVNYNAARSVQS